MDCDQIKTRIQTLREIIYKVGKSRMETLMFDAFAKEFPGCKTLDGRDINDVAVFADFYFHGPNGKDMRKMVWFLTHKFWGRSNYPLQVLERDLLNELGWEYDEGSKCDGTKMQRMHSGGCIKSILVKRKSSLLEVITSVGRKKWHEVLYARKVAGVQAKNIHVKIATEEKDGFQGILGVLEGHEEFPPPVMTVNEVVADTASTGNASSSSEQEEISSNPLMEEVWKMVKGKNLNTMEDLYGELLVSKKKYHYDVKREPVQFLY